MILHACWSPQPPICSPHLTANVWRAMMMAPQVFTLLTVAEAPAVSTLYYFLWEMLIFIGMVGGCEQKRRKILLCCAPS